MNYSLQSQNPVIRQLPLKRMFPCSHQIIHIVHQSKLIEQNRLYSTVHHFIWKYAFFLPHHRHLLWKMRAKMEEQILYLRRSIEEIALPPSPNVSLNSVVRARFQGKVWIHVPKPAFSRSPQYHSIFLATITVSRSWLHFNVTLKL